MYDVKSNIVDPITEN